MWWVKLRERLVMMYYELCDEIQNVNEITGKAVGQECY